MNYCQPCEEQSLKKKYKICNFENCKKKSTFNYRNEKIPIFCKDHSLDGMIDVKNKRCNHTDCEKIPNYNYVNEKNAIFCKDHSLDGMINVVSKRCKTNLCDTRVSNPKYKGHCLRCFIYLFPNEPVARNYKTKETSVADFVKNTFLEQDWVFDKSIDNGCSKRRPDIRLELLTHSLIIEVDENQHRDYDDACDSEGVEE
jgi:hypothetical protein